VCAPWPTGSKRTHPRDRHTVTVRSRLRDRTTHASNTVHRADTTMSNVLRIHEDLKCRSVHHVSADAGVGEETALAGRPIVRRVQQQRPAEADDRAVPGHWEGDLLMGKRMRAIATLVERKTRFVMLVALPNGHAADVVAEALAAKIVELPEQLRRSLTWDQGKEMAAHARFSVKTGVPVYFCDPRSPWQRGSNENTNGLLRQYFPKRTEIAHYSQDDLDDVAAELNGRPRQTLGWKTPSQALDEALR